MNKPAKRAFTLVEMMAVVVIIGILAAVIVPKFFNQVGSAQTVAAKQDINKIDQAITMFRLDTNRIPQSLRDLVREPEDVRNWKGPYLPKMPKDPWGNAYQYEVPGREGREYDIWSFGGDDQEGGEGADADITSWDEEGDI